jgi:hypothetical protein
MRIQVLLPCLLLLTLCGLLVLQKSRSGNVAADAQPVVAHPSPGETGKLEENRITTAAADRTEVFPAPEPEAEAVADLPARPTVDEIATALADADADKRADAREAAVQSGDRNLIPVLQSAAERATDAREKVALLDAADFLGLPTMSEALAAR